MKWKNKIFLILGLSVFSLQHCTEGFEDINIDPTQANTIDPAFQLTRVQLTMTNNNYEHWRAQFIYTSCFVQHNASSFSYWSGDKYNRIDEYSAAQWDSDFPRGVKNIVDMINRTQGDPNFVNFNAAGRILRVYLFHRLTDLYGDLPYSEAGRGFIDNIYFPRYDPQQEIYNDFFRELTEASQAFNPSALPLRGDFWFNNNIDKWKRFAASLRLRLAMRLVKVDPGRAQQEAQAAIAAGVMQDFDDSCIARHTTLERNGNSDVMFQDDNWRLSKTFVDYLKETQDPRLRIWGMTYAADGTPQPDVSLWEGLPNGTDGNSPEFQRYADFVRHNRSTIKDVTSPFFHLMYSEVQFLLAEVAARGWGAPQSAAEHYAKGLEAAIRQVNLYPKADISEAETSNFLSKNAWQGGSLEEQLEQINTQLWVSLYLNGIEAFANWRRVGYPRLTPVNHPIGTTNGTIPRRLYYPPSEAGINPSYTEAVQRQFGGEDELSGRVWWDRQ
jgi:hypothetical protein